MPVIFVPFIFTFGPVKDGMNEPVFLNLPGAINHPVRVHFQEEGNLLPAAFIHNKAVIAGLPYTDVLTHMLQHLV